MKRERIVLGDGLGLDLARWGAAPGHGGARAPVVLLHGFTGSIEAWGDLPAALAERLGPGRPVVAVDLPGHGGSDQPTDPHRYRMEAAAGDLVEVLDLLGAERAVWTGYSMGGRVALGTSVLHPGRVAGLVLESGSPGLPTEGERRSRRRRDDVLAERILSEGMESFVDFWMDLPLFATQRRLPAQVRARERARRLRGAPGGLAGSLRGLGTGAQPSFWETLDELRAPILLMAGAEDEKFAGLADAMGARLPGARRVTVPGAGHAVHLEAPGVWLDAVTSFVRGLPESS